MTLSLSPPLMQLLIFIGVQIVIHFIAQREANKLLSKAEENNPEIPSVPGIVYHDYGAKEFLKTVLLLYIVIPVTFTYLTTSPVSIQITNTSLAKGVTLAITGLMFSAAAVLAWRLTAEMSQIERNQSDAS